MKKSKYCLEIIETPIECMDCEHKFLEEQYVIAKNVNELINDYKIDEMKFIRNIYEPFICISDDLNIYMYKVGFTKGLGTNFVSMYASTFNDILELVSGREIVSIKREQRVGLVR